MKAWAGGLVHLWYRPSYALPPPPSSSVKDYMDGEVTHVVTQEPWDDKFDQVCVCVCAVVCVHLCVHLYLSMYVSAYINCAVAYVITTPNMNYSYI